MYCIIVDSKEMYWIWKVEMNCFVFVVMCERFEEKIK